MTLTTCTIFDAKAIAQQLPTGVAEGQFEDGDMCVVLARDEDEMVVVSPRTGLVFTIYRDGASLRLNS